MYPEPLVLALSGIRQELERIREELEGLNKRLDVIVKFIEKLEGEGDD